MKWITLISAILLTSLTTIGFKTSQLKNYRVQVAYKNSEQIIDSLLEAVNLKKDKIQIYFRAFKQEQTFEVWGKHPLDSVYKKITSYPICQSSGTLGPKRKQGDLQTPEGLYYIDRFNPWSNYHLSLGINYPNKSDRILSPYKNLGGDIFIHGECITIGCIPLTNKLINEIYIFAVEARNSGQEKIPVHIFPCKLDHPSLENLISEDTNRTNQKLWAELCEVYEKFEHARKDITYSINERGNYVLN